MILFLVYTKYDKDLQKRMKVRLSFALNQLTIQKELSLKENYGPDSESQVSRIFSTPFPN